jgi:hypothetical protein
VNFSGTGTWYFPYAAGQPPLWTRGRLPWLWGCCRSLPKHQTKLYNAKWVLCIRNQVLNLRFLGFWIWSGTGLQQKSSKNLITLATTGTVVPYGIEYVYINTVRTFYLKQMFVKATKDL